MASEGGTKEDISSPFGLVSVVGEKGEQIFENGGFLERESATRSRFPRVRTVESRRAKKQSCSTLQGLRVDTDFVEF